MSLLLFAAVTTELFLCGLAASGSDAAGEDTSFPGRKLHARWQALLNRKTRLGNPCGGSRPPEGWATDSGFCQDLGCAAEGGQCGYSPAGQCVCNHFDCTFVGPGCPRGSFNREIIGAAWLGMQPGNNQG